MIGLLEMLVIASLVCGAAAVCLRMLPHAPPRIRFRIALAALGAWVVPWPMISIPLDVPMPSAVVEWREGLTLGAPEATTGASASSESENAASANGNTSSASENPSSATENASAVPASAGRLDAAWSGAAAACILALLFLPGVIRFIGDAVSLRSSLRGWGAISRSGEALHVGLPPELRDVRASIRLVPASAVAATSGWLRPVVWLGERLSDRDREVALVHELSHVRRRDPLWITFVTAMRRVYWWNPAVAWLCREAVLAMESDCDRRCARWFGVQTYTERLASMMLDTVMPRAPRLLAHARTPSLNVRRLKLLTVAPRMRRRDYVLIAMMASIGATSAAFAISEPAMTRKIRFDQTRPEWSRVPIPDTPAGEALDELLDAFNARNAERIAVQLGAFTPQELDFDVPRSSGGLELVAIVSSEPLRIEYVAEDRVGGTRRRGRLEVDARVPSRITRLDIGAAQ